MSLLAKCQSFSNPMMTAGEYSLSWRPRGPYACTPCWDGWVAATILGSKLHTDALQKCTQMLLADEHPDVV